MNSDNIAMGKQCTTMQIGIVSKDSDFAGDFEHSKSTSGGLLCIFGSQNICANKSAVQERDISLSQLNSS